jgi:acetylglutamate/LysW-gamma-L-alpha-aminoadipate kinase
MKSDGTARANGLLVVKIGGGVRPEPVLDDVAAQVETGVPVVLVHGGGPEADRLSAAVGLPVRTVRSPDGTRGRRTDAAAMDVVTMALLGRVKPALVGGLLARGVRAVGLSGADDGLVTAERKQVIRSVEDGRVRLIRDDLSGRITSVRPELLRTLLGTGLVPVVSPPAAGGEGRLLNVDSDQVAASLAVALGAVALVLLTDVPGVLADPRDPTSVIRELAQEPPGASGRMRHKVRAALRARARVPHVHVASGLVDRPVTAALTGGGTVVTGTLPGAAEPVGTDGGRA